MFRKSSSSQMSVGFGGSGALSHVYVQYPPLRCIPESRGFFYDDGNKLLISQTSDQIFSWKTVPFDPHVAPTSDSISEGPILAIRFSLDAKLIAVQRSNSLIQFYNRETGETLDQCYRPEAESILGFFWTDCLLCDIVVVKTSGLDLFTYNSASKSLLLVETRKLNVSWHVYTHESRMVLLASGMQCKSFTGFQFSSAGVIRLPKFEMAMAKSEVNSKPVIALEDIHIITVYGRIYCLQVDKVAMLLHSYRFYRDAVLQQVSLPIYSSNVSVSVVDNVLLVHQVDAKVVILYDIFTDSRAPVSAPLPLLIRGFPRLNNYSGRSTSKESESSETADTNDHEIVVYGNGWTFLVPDLICDFSNNFLWKIHLDLEAISASSSEVPWMLEFLQRRKLEANKAKQLCLEMTRTVILERRPVPIVSSAIDVIVASFSLCVKTGIYLRSTKSDKTSPTPVPNASHSDLATDTPSNRFNEHGKSIKHESLGRTENKFLHRTSNSSDSYAEDIMSSEPAKTISLDCGSGSGSGDIDKESTSVLLQSQPFVSSNNPLDASVSEQQDSQLSSPAISPDEMYSFVFAPAEEEMGGDPSYLVSVILEFLRSANLEKVPVPPGLYILIIQLLARADRYAELGLFITSKVLEPSKEVALQLLESGCQNTQTRKLGLDMLRQLSLHHDYVTLLVQDGNYIEALRYARKHKVTTVRPTLFLEAAFASNDTQHLAAVLRFLTDFIPGFQSTSDHSAYFRILNEMNSSGIVT